MLNRFTKKAQNALSRSLAAAEDLGHTYVGTEHLLIGLAEEEDSAAARILDGRGITPLRLRNIVTEISGVGSKTMLSSADMTPRTKTVIEKAGSLAQDCQGDFVGTEHLLDAICREKDCTGCRILVSCSADPEQLISDIERLSGETLKKGGKQKPSATAEELPNLFRFGYDLTAAALIGKIDPVIGREKETARLIAILCRRTKNNPCLVGEPGVGKTAVVEGLAHRIVSGNVPEPLLDKRIVTLDLTSMIAGAKYRGEFEERMRGILKEVSTHTEIILFIDEVHTLIGAGAAEGAVDAANILKPALARGQIRLIGATTPDEYAKHIEKDSALERRFQEVEVREPDRNEAYAILSAHRDKLEKHHGIRIPDETIDAALSLSIRYLPEKFLPDKAIDLIDEAASRLRLKRSQSQDSVRELDAAIEKTRLEMEEAVKVRNFEAAALSRDKEKELVSERMTLQTVWEGSDRPRLSPDDIASVVTEATGIPIARTNEESRQDPETLIRALKNKIFGQDEAVNAVARAVCRGRLGLSDGRRPIGSFLFLGPTGVGKTELSRALAETVFGSPSCLIRFDMTEYREAHSISRLIGSPPGYIGHEEGGQLTERLRRRPYSVVLFDEIEKANREVLGILLQMMDDGKLTDSRGRSIDCRNCILILTSNLGANHLNDDHAIGFSSGNTKASDTAIRSAVMREVERFFPPEFLNRLDETIVFRRLTLPQLSGIAREMLSEIAKRAKRAGVNLEWDETLPDLIASDGSDSDNGARPMRRYLTKWIEDPLADLILSRKEPPPSVHIGIADGKPSLSLPDPVV